MDAHDRQMSVVVPISSPKLAQVIASRLRKEIVCGQRNAGDFLPFEAELVTLYRTSKPIVREALRILETEGLIEVRRGGRAGAQVLAPSIASATQGLGLVLQYRGTSMADVWEARSMLECDAVEIVAGCHRAEDVRVLEATAARITSVLDQPEVFAVDVLNFHEELVRLTRNRTLHALTQALREIVLAGTQLAGQNLDPDQVAINNRRATRANAKLIALIAAGEVAEAVDLWVRHLAAVGDVLLQMVGPAQVIDIID